MAAITGANGLLYYDLSHQLMHGAPEWPSSANLNIRSLKYHAKDGVVVKQYEGIMHRTTHMDTASHVSEYGKPLGGFATWRFFGTGVAVSIPKTKWQVITPADLENARPRIQPGDIVMINTGMHKLLADTDEYYAYSPGLYKEAGEWLVERKVKLVGVDTNALDHPLGTKLLDHGPGPSHMYLADEYHALTGRNAMDDFPHWEPAHKVMLNAGIPGIENVGGDLDLVTGKRCTFMAFPWRWHDGDGCIVRVVAIVDPRQQYRLSEAG